VDELKERALEIFDAYQKNQWPTHQEMDGWRDIILDLVSCDLFQLDQYREGILPYVRIGDRGECYIELPGASPIMFRVVFDRQRGLVLGKLMSGYDGLFCVGLHDKGRWLFPGWNPTYSFEYQDVAIGKAFVEVTDDYRGE
jgi:hypothetical protein